ncbi:xylose isomerase [Calothrix sp. HK-06]|nr:xylose isomerase [Calothrix sp. HK-06]
MKLNNYHLTYCTNIHPGEAWSQVFNNLQKYIPTLKARLSEHKPFGIGLSLANIATHTLLKENTLSYFQWWLEEHNLYVFTLNGFPYGTFHGQPVKDQVYAPDWSTKERLEYTFRLLHILAPLLPEGVQGSISTLPISYKPWFKQNQVYLSFVIMNATRHIARVVAEMVRVHRKTGKFVYLALEPEPDGVIENSAEVINYFQIYLLPLGGKYLANDLGISQEKAEQLLLEHVRICYDTCHFALEYEKPVSTIKQFLAAGIKIGKIQISAALKLNLSDDIKKHAALSKKLRNFAESTYLHQAIARDINGQLYQYSDLDEALPDFEDSIAQEWRIHFHVPIVLNEYQDLLSTQDDIIEILELLKIQNFCNHLEIETYTWEVLPHDMKLDIITSIQREYKWIMQKLCQAPSKISSSI